MVASFVKLFVENLISITVCLTLQCYVGPIDLYLRFFSYKRKLSSEMHKVKQIHYCAVLLLIWGAFFQLSSSQCETYAEDYSKLHNVSSWTKFVSLGNNGIWIGLVQYQTEVSIAAMWWTWICNPKLVLCHSSRDPRTQESLDIGLRGRVSSHSALVIVSPS